MITHVWHTSNEAFYTSTQHIGLVAYVAMVTTHIYNFFSQTFMSSPYIHTNIFVLLPSIVCSFPTQVAVKLLLHFTMTTMTMQLWTKSCRTNKIPISFPCKWPHSASYWLICWPAYNATRGWGGWGAMDAFSFHVFLPNGLAT